MKVQKGYMIVERVDVPKNLVLPENADPSSDEVFKVVAVNDFVIDHMRIKVGDIVSLVGYLHNLTYKGKRVTVACQKDVKLIWE